jgi:hypothetical protein
MLWLRVQKHIMLWSVPSRLLIAKVKVALTGLKK